MLAHSVLPTYSPRITEQWRGVGAPEASHSLTQLSSHVWVIVCTYLPSWQKRGRACS